MIGDIGWFTGGSIFAAGIFVALHVFDGRPWIKILDIMHNYKTPMQNALGTSVAFIVMAFAAGSIPIFLFDLATEQPNPFAAYGSYWGALISMWALVTTTAFLVANTKTEQEIDTFQQRYYALMEIHHDLGGIQMPSTTHRPEVRDAAIREIRRLHMAARRIPGLSPKLRDAFSEIYKALDVLTVSLQTAIWQQEEWASKKAQTLDERIRTSWATTYSELRVEIHHAEHVLEALGSPIYRDTEL